MSAGWIILTYRCLGVRVLLLLTASVLVLLIALVLISGYVFGLYTFYDEIVVPENIRGNTVVVTGFALAPFTSLIKVSTVASAISNSSGVEAVSYEVITMAEVKGEGVIVRGTDLSFLKKYVGYRVIEGEDIRNNCYSCAWVGADLARDLGLRTGDVVVLYSVFSRTPFIFRVRGVLDIPEPYRYEMIVPYVVGQLIRGVSGDAASVAMIILKPGASADDVIAKVGVGGAEGRLSLLERVFIALRYAGKEVSASLYSHASEVFVERIGIPRGALVAVVLAFVFIASVGSYVIGLMPFIVGKSELILLHEQGVGWVKIKLAVLLLGAAVIAVSYAVAGVFASKLAEVLNVCILHHRIHLVSDALINVAIPAFTLLFYGVGTAVADVNES